MIIAAEAFVDDEEYGCDWDDKILLHEFSEFLAVLGTKPVTIPIPSLVDDMLGNFQLACSLSPELQGFTWVRSPDPRATLEAFVRTRECFLYLDGRMPVVEATFGRPVPQSAEELAVEIHYTWCPPTVNFESLRNVFDESRSFHLKPTMGRPCEDLDAVYDIDPNGSVVNWNAAEGRFEGHCTSALASIAGAERLESFTMPLNMTAQCTMHLPGEMMFERTIRLAIPITIKRKPLACSSDHELDESPVVRRPAVSVKIPSTSSTPQSAIKCVDARYAKKEDLSPDYKELGGLLRRKATAASDKLSSPLTLNPLSLAQLWEATAPSPYATNVQCWVADVNQPCSSPAEPVQVQATEEWSPPPPVPEHTTRVARDITPRQRLPLRVTSGNRRKRSTPVDKIDDDKRKSPKTADVQSPCNNDREADSVIAEHTPCNNDKEAVSVIADQNSCNNVVEKSSEEGSARVDSVLGFGHQSGSEEPSDLQDKPSSLHGDSSDSSQHVETAHPNDQLSHLRDNTHNSSSLDLITQLQHLQHGLSHFQGDAPAFRDMLQEFREIAGTWHRRAASLQSRRTSRRPLQRWREAPEKLSEADKDVLQVAIQESHRLDTEERPKRDLEVMSDEEWVEWDTDSLFNGSDGDADGEESEELKENMESRQ
jgi:hypothetical protein